MTAPRSHLPQPLITEDGLQQEIRNILDELDPHDARVLAERLMQGYLNLPDRIELHGPSGEWSALYVDGELAVVGDSYLSEVALQYHVLPITHIEGEDFMRGQHQRDGVAQTTKEVVSYRTERMAAEREAAELRAQAEALLARAEELESS